MDILWSGPRESDILDLDMFCASTTIFGSNQGTNQSYATYKNIRVDHNQPNCVPNSYYNDRLEEWIECYPDLKILYYNAIYSQYLPEKHKNRAIGCNDLSLLELLDSKSDVRNIASRVINVVPFQRIDNANQLLQYKSDILSGIRYVLQENHSSGGYGTHIIDKNSIDSIIETFDPCKGYFISEYFDKSISVNIHCVIFDDDIIIFPGSIQLVKEINHKINYIGSDFVEYNSLSNEVKAYVKDSVKKLCEMLRTMGYRGVLGFDFLLLNQKPYLLEINARFQASTVLINRALKNFNLPSMQKLHLMAFRSGVYEKNTVIENINVPYSMISYTTETWRRNEIPKCLENIEAIDLDGYDGTEKVVEGAYLFRTIFKTNICSINPEGTIWIYENIYDDVNDFTEGILNKSLLHIKISLLNQGVRITDAAKSIIKKQGEIRNAVFSAVDIKILNKLHINCPSDVKMISFTPWRIDIDIDNNLNLYYYNFNVGEVSIDMADPHASKLTKSGIPYQRISFWATDRMRIHHTISCLFKKNDVGCLFCEIPKIEQSLCLTDAFEVIDFYLNQKNTFRHFLIGGGSETFDDESEHITQITNYIREKCDKPIYLMCLPPKDLSVLERWYNAGITEVAFNLELYDRKKAAQLMPGKGKIPLEQYFAAFDKAVSLWGRNGNVRTLFIAGLESKEVLLNGINAVCSHGVMPILSIFRALNGTPMENTVPPSNTWLYNLYNDAEKICLKYNLHLGPSCPACQNNTLSLPF